MMDSMIFKINGNKLTNNPENYKPHINQPKIKFNFEFEDNEWARGKAVAVFYKDEKEYAVPIDKYRDCFVPQELLGSTFFRFKVVGVFNNKRIDTNTLLIIMEV